MEKMRIGCCRKRRVLLVFMNGKHLTPVQSESIQQKLWKTVVFMKNPVFVWDDWLLWKKYGLDVVELVEFYLSASMRRSASRSERIHSTKTLKNRGFHEKSHFCVRWLGLMEKIRIGCCRTRRVLLVSMNGQHLAPVQSESIQQKLWKTVVFMKNPVFVWDDWPLWKKYESDVVEFVEFYLLLSMLQHRVNSLSENSGKPWLSWKIRFFFVRWLAPREEIRIGYCGALVEFCLPPSMKTSDSSSQRIHSPKTLKSRAFYEKFKREKVLIFLDLNQKN